MNIIKKILSNEAVKELIDCLLLFKEWALRAVSYIGNAANKSSDKTILGSIAPESNTEHFLLLCIFGIAMLLIRIIPVYNAVFTNWPGEHGNYVNFAADDAVYHMRLVHNTLYHYPWRIFFDPFSYFPYGMQVIFGPLFTLIVATTALIIGFGNPSPELVNHVGAYIPPVMGALCLIPVYLIVRRIFGKTSAIISAFVLAFLPGEFLSRSTLGFIDHHVAEVLFSTVACAFFVYALVSFRITPKNNRTALVYGLLCGITFGSFILIWQGAMLFGLIFLAFFTVQLLIDHINHNDTRYLLFLASLTYIPPVMMLLPYTLAAPLSILPSCNIPILVVVFSIFIICYLLHIMFKRKQLTTNLVLTLIGVIVFVMFIVNESLTFFNAFKDFHNTVSTFGALTISEVRSAIIGPDGKFTARIFWSIYSWIMPLTLIGLGCLGCCAYKKKHPAEIFLLIWTLVIIAITCKQVRFNYYLAINASILSGYAIYFLFNLIGYLDFSKKITARRQKVGFLVLLCLVAFVIARPMYLLLKHNNLSSGAHITHEWYNTLLWLRTHTPDPQGSFIDKSFDYNGYYAVPKNLQAPYNYPESAYGVMTWWDEGHQITYIAHRIPNANPHQQGVVDKTSEIGSAPFFTSTDEGRAVKNLDTVGSRYVIINKDMATAKFRPITIWSSDTEGWENARSIKMNFPEFPGETLNLNIPVDSQKFLQSMVSRLFYDDASGLQHFRLIHESEGDYYAQARMFEFLSKKPLSVRLGAPEFHSKQYNEMFDTVEKRNKIQSIDKGNNTFIYSVRPPVKFAKIFEKVKGATINGRVASNVISNTPVKLTLKLKTKYDRIFVYEQITSVDNGRYNFTVPYPTTEMRGDNYSYDIEPIGNYQIQIGDKVIEVAVPEEAVMLGKDIVVL